MDVGATCTSTGDSASIATTDSVANVPDDDDDDDHHRRGDHSLYVMGMHGAAACERVRA